MASCSIILGQKIHETVSDTRNDIGYYGILPSSIYVIGPHLEKFSIVNSEATRSTTTCLHPIMFCHLLSAIVIHCELLTLVIWLCNVVWWYFPLPWCCAHIHRVGKYNVLEWPPNEFTRRQPNKYFENHKNCLSFLWNWMSSQRQYFAQQCKIP